jgi:hypothetical protein
MGTYLYVVLSLKIEYCLYGNGKGDRSGNDVKESRLASRTVLVEEGYM